MFIILKLLQIYICSPFRLSIVYSIIGMGDRFGFKVIVIRKQTETLYIYIYIYIYIYMYIYIYIYNEMNDRVSISGITLFIISQGM